MTLTRRPVASAARLWVDVPLGGAIGPKPIRALLKDSWRYRIKETPNELSRLVVSEGWVDTGGWEENWQCGAMPEAKSDERRRGRGTKS